MQTSCATTTNTAFQSLWRYSQQRWEDGTAGDSMTEQPGSRVKERRCGDKDDDEHPIDIGFQFEILNIVLYK